MPKEKTSTRKTKAKAVAEGGKKKKGECNNENLVLCQLMWLKDPNAPKRGLSAYMFFANEQRDNVREENPGITFGKHCSWQLAYTSHRLFSDRLLTSNFVFRPSWQSSRWEMEGTQYEAARAIWG